MKFSATIPIIMIAAGLSFAQLLPQKPAETVKVDRAMIFKVDYSDDAGVAADSSRSIGQPEKFAKQDGLTNNALFANALCATGAFLSTLFDGNGSADCFVIPAKKLKF